VTLDAKPHESSALIREDAIPDLTLLLAATESAVNAMAITDRKGVIRWANAAFCDLAGYSVHEMAGRNISILNSGRHPKALFRDMWHVLLRGRPWQGRLINRRKDGTEYVHNATISPVRTPGGEITHFISIRQDHGFRTLSAEGLPSQTTEMAAAAGQFACGIARDLSGLLTVINRNTESLLNGPELPPEVSECSGRIVRASEQAATLAGWLLAFSRRQTKRFRDIDLNGMILRLKRHLQAILPQDIELKIALEPTLGNVSADENSLEEALIHLVVNAREAMPEGGKLTLETASVRQRPHGEPESAAQGYVLWRVTDTGVGMETSAQRRMFEPFFTTKPGSPAAGLGLSAVYGIVKQAGGWISVYSEKGVGSSVEIFLPSSNRA
jgi:two-component system, cell cycle sensor histidine kinase and response regulator CckA